MISGFALEAHVHKAGDVAVAAPGLCIEPYSYSAEPASNPACAEWPLIELDVHGNPIGNPAHAAAPEPTAAQIEDEIAQAARQSFQAGFEQGLAEGRDAERQLQSEAHAVLAERVAAGLAGALAEFKEQRERYFASLEQETVKLALAIAARVLRREAQADPLLLLGGVRVALGQLSAVTDIRLRVPASDASLWEQTVALLPGREVKPNVIAEEEMHLGDCILETELGSADLSMHTQLAEIERALFENSGARSARDNSPEEAS